MTKELAGTYAQSHTPLLIKFSRVVESAYESQNLIVNRRLLVAFLFLKIVLYYWMANTLFPNCVKTFEFVQNYTDKLMINCYTLDIFNGEYCLVSLIIKYCIVLLLNYSFKVRKICIFFLIYYRFKLSLHKKLK